MLQAVFDVVGKLACVAQSYHAGGGGGGEGGTRDVRALQKQLRRLKLEAGEALAVGEGPAEAS